MVNPSLNEVKKLEATANPCIKLSIQLANRFRYPVIFLVSSFVENLNIFSINRKVMIPTISQSPV